MEKPKPLTIAQAKKYCGGKWPEVRGKKYTYPKTDQGWTRLINTARNFRYREGLAIKSGKKPPQSKFKYKYEYILFHCSPYSRGKRAIRNKHRQMHGLKVGDPRVVHHHDQKSMDFKKTVVLDHCQHKKVHGGSCSGSMKRKSKPRGSK